MTLLRLSADQTANKPFLFRKVELLIPSEYGMFRAGESIPSRTPTTLTIRNTGRGEIKKHG